MAEEKRTFKVVAPDGELKEWEFGASEAKKSISLESCQSTKTDEIIKHSSNQIRAEAYIVVFKIGKWLGNVIKHFVLQLRIFWQKMTAKKYSTYDDFQKGKCLMVVEEDLIISEKELRYEQSYGRSYLKLIMVISCLREINVVFTKGKVVGESEYGLAEFDITGCIRNLEIFVFVDRKEIVIDLSCLISLIEKCEVLNIELLGSETDLFSGQKRLRKIRFEFAKLGGKLVKYHCTFCDSSAFSSDLLFYSQFIWDFLFFLIFSVFFLL